MALTLNDLKITELMLFEDGHKNGGGTHLYIIYGKKIDDACISTGLHCPLTIITQILVTMAARKIFTTQVKFEENRAHLGAGSASDDVGALEEKTPALQKENESQSSKFGGKFEDPKWRNGTWDLQHFTKDGKVDWDAVIDAGATLLLLSIFV
eukprot:Gb_14224 [translate_table: standard]